MKDLNDERPVIHPILSNLPGSKLKKGKIVISEEAVRIIRDGDTIATDGFVGACFAEEIAVALEKFYLETGTPRNLTIVYAAGQGDGKDRGLNHLGHEGLVGKVIGGHIGLAPKLQRLIRENLIFGYNMPQGVVAHLFRDIAAGKPGTITRVGLGTFIDPRIDGGKLNEKTFKEGRDIIELIQVSGQEYLLYKAFLINVAIIRGTTADTDGNISMETRTPDPGSFSRGHGGQEFWRLCHCPGGTDRGPGYSEQPRREDSGDFGGLRRLAPPAHHWQTFSEPYNPAFSGEIKVPMHSIAPMELGPGKSSQGGRPSNSHPIVWSISVSACRKAWPMWPMKKRSSNI